MSVIEIVTEAVGSWCQPYESAPFVVVPTFHSYPSNACVQVFVEGGSDNFVVSDGGGALQVASTLGLGDLDIEKHLRAAARNGCALVNSSGWIFARGATRDSLTSYVSTIAECSKAAAVSCARHFKPDAKVSFKREVAEELVLSFHKRLERKVTLIGHSNKPHKFDFGLRGGGDQIIVIDAVTPDANSINSAIVSHLDVTRANLPHVQQRVVYDDRYKWRAADLSLLTVGATPIGFTQAVSSLARLVH